MSTEVHNTVNFKILNQNIRSLRSNFDVFLAELMSRNISPEIIVLSEIWISQQETNFYEIPNYVSFLKANEYCKAGGIKIYVKSTIEVINCCPLVFQSADVLKIEFKVNTQIFTLIAIYRLHSVNKNVFLIELENCLKDRNVANMKNNLFIMGDININILDNNVVVDEYNTLLCLNGLECLLKQPTRITDSTSTCIDHVFARIANKDNTGVEVIVVEANITDHAMSLTTVNVRDLEVGRQLIGLEQPAYQVDYVALGDRLDNTDWSEVYAQDNPSIAFDIFYDMFQNNITQSKVTLVKNKVRTRKIKPWMNDFISMKIKIKNNIFQKLKKHPQNEKLKNYFKKYRNKLQIQIRELRDSFYAKCFDNCNGNSRAIWKVINEVTNQKTKGSPEISLNINGNTVSNSVDVANEFNQFFLTIVDRLNIHKSKPNNFNALDFAKFFNSKQVTESMFVSNVTELDLINVISSLKNRISPGIDNISSSLIKKVYPQIINVLLFLINLSFEKGIFPEKLKVAVVIPLHKQGSKNNCNNFRPISLLSSFSKIYEKLMKQKLVGFLEKTNFFSHTQFGFREGLNTENALQNFIYRVYNGLNDNKKVSAIFLDIKKAFDCVDHTILLSKLNKCGIRGVVLNWFESYLRKRKQCVKIKNSYSELGIINVGVPQGSVLGAILFLIYINDLCNANLNGNITSFADDTALCYVMNEWDDINEAMNLDFQALQWWFTDNQLLLSPEKTKFINFSLRKEIKLKNEIIYKCIKCLCLQTRCTECAVVEQTNSIKYLGIYLDQELSWKTHVLNLKSKLNNTLRYFYFLKNCCNDQILRMLYFALVHSRMDYGLFCWGGAFETNTKHIFIQQKRFIRIICGKNKTEHTYPLFLKQRILPLKYMFVHKVLKIHYIMSGNLPDINIDSYKKKLRKQDIFTVPKPNFTFYIKSYIFLGPRIFNTIPSMLQTIKSVSLFSHKVKQWLIQQENIDSLTSVQV